jgi:hypothetical protein
MTWRTADPDAKLSDPDDAAPPVETTFADAQSHVNFVVFEPEWLPEDCYVTDVTRRPEQPPGRPNIDAADIGQTPHSEGNPSSVRVVVSGEDRQLRLKQFLYDWAPCSASVAPLWRTPDPEPFDCGDAVGWLGTDYKDNRGACVQRDRTQIEASVREGEFGDDELTSLFRGLTVASPEEARVVRDVPFHQLNYWVRYQVRPPGVPHGLWDYGVARPYDDSRPLSPVALCNDPPVAPLIPQSDQFVLDSALAFPGADAIECVFRNRANASDHLWLTAAEEGSSLAPELPPEPSDQSAAVRESIDCRDTTVHHAALTEDRGAWEAFWAEDGTRYALWASSSQHLDGGTFQSLVDGLEVP